ncbi:MAG: hypothetical protein GWN84_13260 [Gammaproteobacteria bacterium]|nr:hypothetical protein [Gammaproteobacteria bacterium]NIR83798.1 hypothetical protein [Gammaproteobacteria bacterium]NIU05124.1 hypothetical protein [Gammaproteobacteria bacterium]NIV51961.1 hypothetical protein [Gammaproteobacteria bacterium]NIX86397.1 hypothetical protein [Gammaproteobacteria bacterium]
MRDKSYLNKEEAAPLTSRQMAKVLGGVMSSGANTLGPRLARAVWVEIYKAWSGRTVAVEDVGKPDERVRQQISDFSLHLSSILGAFAGFCRRDDIVSALAFYAEQEEPWRLVEKSRS